MIGCDRKPLYLQGDIALKINVHAHADINTLWKSGWRDSLKYNWDESIYGPIGYTLPIESEVVIFNKGSLINRKNILIEQKNIIDIEPNNKYDLLVYSKEYYWLDTYYEGGRYYIETPSTSSSSNNVISNQYQTVNQPGEIFSGEKRDIYITDDISEFEEEVWNGKYIYVYNIDETIVPVSYIYIVQFIIVNDDNSPIIEAKDIQNFTISGISSKKNLFNNTPIYTGNKQISTYDIKPGQIRGDSLLFASRVTVLDLLPDEQGSSWQSQIDYLYYTNIDVDTYNYGEVTGTKDITQQLRDNPKGGIITIIILNSELKKDTPSGNNTFGIDLAEWQQHIYDVF